VVGQTQIFFEGAWRDSTVVERARLTSGMTGMGPARVEQVDTTTIVPPRVSARVDARGNLVLEAA
jgi:N-methylhydantoinase A